MRQKEFKLSNVDLKIIKVLGENSRLSYREISKLSKVGSATIHQKVRRWLKENFIKRFTIDINWELLGRKSLAYVSVLVDFPAQKEAPKKYVEMLEKINQFSYVESVSSVTGRTDLILRASARSNDEMNQFLDNLRLLEGVSRTETYMSLFDGKKINSLHGKKFDYKESHLRILQALQENARASLRQIAKKAGISHASVHTFLKELIDNKIIMRFTVILNNEKMGLATRAYVLITFDYPLLLKLKVTQKDIVGKLIKRPEVLKATAVTGRVDAILLVNVENMYKLDEFVIGLRGIKGIKRTETLVASRHTQKEIDDISRLFKQDG